MGYFYYLCTTKFNYKMNMKKEDLTTQEALEKIEHLDKIIHNQREKLWKLTQKRQNLYKDMFDFEGKFIKYTFVDDPLYMFVDEVCKSGDEVLIRGYGFKYFYSEYDDCNYATYDTFERITLTKAQLNRIDDVLNNFKVITKEEYISEFNKLYKGLYNNLMKRIENIE